MIAKKYRIPRVNLAYLLEKGDEKRSKLFIIRYKKNNKKFCRYRVIISKKLDTKAVKRNRLRRQLYETIRLNLIDQPTEIKENLDLIFIPKKIILKTALKEIANDLKWKNLIKYWKILLYSWSSSWQSIIWWILFLAKKTRFYWILEISYLQPPIPNFPDAKSLR